MKASDLSSWRFLSEVPLDLGSCLQPSLDEVVASNTDGLRLQKSSPENFYLSCKEPSGQWLLRLYPIAPQLREFLASTKGGDVRIFYFHESLWGPEILGLNTSTSMWLALRKRPDPIVIASLLMRFRPPVSVTYPESM
jgi:hypothetical protein